MHRRLRSSRAIVLLPIVLAVGCKELQVRVTTLNTNQRRTGETWTAYADRMERVSTTLQPHVPFGNLFGFQELGATRQQVGLGPITEIAHDVPCLIPAGRPTMAANCLGRWLTGSSDSADQAGAIGFAFTSTSFEIVPGSVRQSHIGERHDDVIFRRLVGARLRHKKTGLVVPFYSFHFSATGDATRIHEEVDDLIATMRRFQVATDLSPVLAGDFNCNTWGQQHRRKMLQAFHVASSRVFSVDRILVGRPAAFPSLGALVEVPSSETVVCGVNTPDLTDHNAVSIELSFDPDRPAQLPPPPVTVHGKGCGQPPSPALSVSCSGLE